MRYYTKEWYDLMQRLSYTSGMTMIPDNRYSDEEIQAFYESDLREEIENDRKLHNTPPDYSWAERLLDPDGFDPKNMLFENGETGELFHPDSPEIAREYIEQERKEREEAFAKRPPFDPTETIACFKECHQNMLRYGALRYPEWVRETVDKRLLALNRMPETAYHRLKKEEEENQRAFGKIMEEASVALEAQNIPEEIRSQLHFHDAHLLALKKAGADMELYLRKDGGWPKETTPYIKIIFKNVSKLEREKGLVLRMKRDDNGEVFSNCQYLYDELYKTEVGYELHMLLCTTKALRYLTIGCEDICFIDNIDF